MTKKEDTFDEEYFERGLVTGKSGYMNYSWMPEQTMRMAYYFIRDLPLENGHKVLDFGCAKGFLVRAFRHLDVEAFGADISEYAMGEVDRQTARFCKLLNGLPLSKLFGHEFDWIITKDVFEHIPEKALGEVLRSLRESTKHLFAAIPLAEDDSCGKYIIPEYDNDVTHCVRKSQEWWRRRFSEAGFELISFSHSFRGCKENWVREWEKGNGFFKLRSKR